MKRRRRRLPPRISALFSISAAVTTSRKKSGTERWRRRPIRRIMTAEPGFRDGRLPPIRLPMPTRPRDLTRTLLPLWIWARKQTAATLPALRASAKRRRRWILPARWPIRARKKNFPPQPARWNWLPGRSAPRRRKFWPKTSIPTVRFTARQLILTRCGRIRRAFTISISTANMKI